ncbi:MAG: histidinol-phosphatase [Pseudomonadota bacterium]
MHALPKAGLSDLVRTAETMADAAARVTLKYFRSDALEAANKDREGGFDPVTLADEGSEQAMRDVLAAQRPEDGIFGEEFANVSGTSGLTWVLDPIDGTRAFISGMPVWGTLIALDDGNAGVLGIIDQPYIGERFVGHLGDSTAAWLERNGKRQRISARPCATLDEAVFYTTDPYLFSDDEASAFTALRARARLTRFGTDCYAYALLAGGHVDLVVESGLAAYDIAAHIPLIKAAGGIVTDWQGADCRWGGRVIAAGDARVHSEALEILSRVP